MIRRIILFWFLAAQLVSAYVPRPGANGNLTNDGTRSFLYDAENQVTNINVAGQWKTEFVYDGLRRRRIERDYAWSGSVWVETNEVHSVYDRILLVQQRNSNNVPVVTYTRGLGRRRSLQRAGGIGGLLGRTDANGPAFYHADGAGNITALIDGNQNIVARYEYDPFLRPIGIWGPLGPVNKMRGSSMPAYNGGVVGFWGRTFDTIPMRWLSPDPIGLAGGINPYAFVGNSPVNLIDPLGFEGNPIMGGGQAYSSSSYGSGGSFYGPGYSWNPNANGQQSFDDLRWLLNPPPFPNPTQPQPYNALNWDPYNGQWIQQRDGLQSDPVMETAVLMAASGLASSASSFRVCPAAANATMAVQVGDYTLTDTVAGHLGERVGGLGDYSGSLSRPYLQSPSTINEIMSTGQGVADPGGLSGALRYDVPGAFRGSGGTWELVVDPSTQTIYHFNFTTGN